MKKCDICGKWFSTAQALRGHQRLTHYSITEQEAKVLVEENWEQSKIIEEKYENIRQLQNKIQQLQALIAGYKCPNCGRQVGWSEMSIKNYSNLELDDKYKSHWGALHERPGKLCPECGYFEVHKK
ncbi:C2H2-type zinc finger protein [Chloroflexota bacterium]